MFTGIIETIGKIKKIIPEKTLLHFWIESPFYKELKVDQSMAHNGVCLTIVEKKNKLYRVTSVEETLNRSNLAFLKPGDEVNLERCMRADARFDGHIVQGHVDDVAICKSIKNVGGSWIFTFKTGRKKKAGLLVEKGSVSLNGISLTVFSIQKDKFSVAIIPYTYHHTNFHLLKKGSPVNIEYDIIGKYIQKMLHK
ncbi:MAG: riboflavin synthase [Bacteroidia bacterium]